MNKARMLSFKCPLLVFMGLLCFCPAGAEEEPVRGVVISTHGSGRDWGQDGIVPTLKDIKTVGANWVSTHPYARIWEDGSVVFWEFDPEDPPAELVRPIREAHALGLKVVIKPHLAYWRSTFQWRGEIEFYFEEHWEQFWTDYRRWILTLVRACKDADGFVIGTELDKTLGHEAEWRQLIADIRAITDMPLTYGANWTDFERVPFWDAVDVIGIQSYFPVSEKQRPTEVDVRKGWRKLIDRLNGYAKKHNRKVFFTELGYNQSLLAAKEPWNYRVDGEEARPLQEMCMRVALDVIEREPQVTGVLLWKWFPYPRPVGRNFVLATPRIMKIIAEAWEGKVPTVAFDEAAWEGFRRERRRRPQTETQ